MVIGDCYEVCHTEFGFTFSLENDIINNVKPMEVSNPEVMSFVREWPDTNPDVIALLQHRITGKIDATTVQKALEAASICVIVV
jgi:hypothetical protein